MKMLANMRQISRDIIFHVYQYVRPNTAATCYIPHILFGWGINHTIYTDFVHERLEIHLKVVAALFSVGNSCVVNVNHWTG